MYISGLEKRANWKRTFGAFQILNLFCTSSYTDFLLYDSRAEFSWSFWSCLSLLMEVAHTANNVIEKLIICTALQPYTSVDYGVYPWQAKCSQQAGSGRAEHAWISFGFNMHFRPLRTDISLWGGFAVSTFCRESFSPVDIQLQIIPPYVYFYTELYFEKIWETFKFLFDFVIFELISTSLELLGYH